MTAVKWYTHIYISSKNVLLNFMWCLFLFLWNVRRFSLEFSMNKWFLFLLQYSKRISERTFAFQFVGNASYTVDTFFFIRQVSNNALKNSNEYFFHFTNVLIVSVCIRYSFHVISPFTIEFFTIVAFWWHYCFCVEKIQPRVQKTPALLREPNTVYF